MSVQPTADELANIKLCAQKLWDLDENRLVPEQHYGIDVQGGKKMYHSQDAASQKLFKGVSKSTWAKTTYKIFYHLLDNYERETGKEEVVTTREIRESQDFLSACMDTKPLQYVHNYLVEKGIASKDELTFKKMLYQMWFSLYRRDTQNDSCGFEHVFVGESDEGEIKGLHNWIQFFIEESRGNLDYRGYIVPRRRGAPPPDGEERLLSVQLFWKGEKKPVTSMFIGTSPEFEIALYSLYFLAGEEHNMVDILNYDVDIRCHRIRSKYGDKISTCFPDIVNET
ncbi:hypothetical protein BSKO_10661 [Bryopsis sp. KO-2023]|nr:hypothetical protein BSKO_10661 [Bryopsis sp. KO-2023]